MDTLKEFSLALAKENIFRKYGTYKVSTTKEDTIWITPFNTNIDWIGEFGSIPEVSVSSNKLNINSHKIATLSTIDSDFMADINFDIKNHLLNEFSILFGQAEEYAFINGDGAVGKDG